MLCVEKDGSAHLELSLLGCCGDELASEDVHPGEVPTAGLMNNDPADEDCADCTDFSVATPALLMGKSPKLEASIGKLLTETSTVAPSGWRFGFCDEPDARGPAIVVAPRSELARVGICMLLI